MRISAELLELGVNPWEISIQLYESMPAARQYLLAKVLETLELSFSDRVASMYVTEQMLRETSATFDMTDGFINFARGIKGVEVAVLFSERGEGWKISFRSKGKIDVSEIAFELGGGGHHNAAGCFIEGDLDTAKNAVHRAISKKIELLNLG